MINPDLLDVMQFIAYVTLTITGITVAIVSLRHSFRSNFGWQPIILSVTHGLKSKEAAAQEEIEIFVSYEIWNRRTYPVVLRSIAVTSSRLEFNEKCGIYGIDDEWVFRSSTHADYRPVHVLAGGDHREIEFKGTLFKEQSLDDLDSKFLIECNYYDPQRDKHDVIRQSLSYTMKAKKKWFGAKFLTKSVTL